MTLVFTLSFSHSLFSPALYQVLRHAVLLSLPLSNQLNHLQLVWHRLRLNRPQSVYLQQNLLAAALLDPGSRLPTAVKTIWSLLCWVYSLPFLSVLLSVYIRHILYGQKTYQKPYLIWRVKLGTNQQNCYSMLRIFIVSQQLFIPSNTVHEENLNNYIYHQRGMLSCTYLQAYFKWTNHSYIIKKIYIVIHIAIVKSDTQPHTP